MDVSVLMPSRNEMWLKNTIDDVMAHREAKTEVIAVLDGAWPTEPIPDHPDVHLVYLPESIGQRAATNLAARLSGAKYVMKLDAHCSVEQGFDRKLIEADLELGRPDVTQIPAQFNLHAWDWVCNACGERTYQGPSLSRCSKCNAVSDPPGSGFTRDVVWKIRKNRRTEFWRVDNTLHFNYWSGYSKRPEAKGEIADVLSSLGACFFMRRERFFEIGGLEESFGSWGQFGQEIAFKSWLSGGRHVVNKRTWFAHMFRTQGGDFGFCYPLSGRQVDHARKASQKMWFGNAWPKQVLPLSWLLEKFWPIDGWTEADLAKAREAGAMFKPVRSLVGGLVGQSVSLSADSASSVLPPPSAESVRGDGQQVAFGTVGLSGVDGGPVVGPHEIVSECHQGEVGGITAPLVVADDVVKLGDVSTAAHGQGRDQPCVHESVGEGAFSPKRKGPVSTLESGSGPIPATSLAVDGDLREEHANALPVQVGDAQQTVSLLETWIGEDTGSHAPIVAAGTRPDPAEPAPAKPPRGGILFYTDNRGDPAILEAVRRQLLRAKGDLPLVCVSLQPIPDFGINVVLPLQRGRLTMFKQILVGLEVLDSDFVWHCEHDVLYHPSHFEFVPPTRDAYYYNENVYKVDATTGQGVFYWTKQTSGLCADRQLLLQHYRKRVERVERDGYDHAMGYEPGCHKPPRGVDEYPAIRWMSSVPNVDIRHGCNLTKTRWDPAEFRDKSTCQGWTLVDEIPGWGVTKGRFVEWLQEVAHG